MEKTLKPVVGNYVTGEEFWNRDTELQEFIFRLKERDHIRLVAPRRIGKTSLMREAERRMGGGIVCLQLDFQKTPTVEDAIVQMTLATRPFQPIWEKTKGLFKNVLNDIQSKIDELGLSELKVKFRQGVAGDWQIKGETLLGFLAQHDQTVVVFIDELPVFVDRLLKQDEKNGTDNAEIFMYWLRAVCSEFKGKFGLVVTGSIGFEPVLERAGLTQTIANFHRFTLDTWNESTATECICALAAYREFNLDADVPQYMVQKLGSNIPGHVQIFFDELLYYSKLRKIKQCSTDDVDHVWDHRMIGARGYTELSTYEERLRKVLSKERLAFAIDLLTEAAVVGNLSPGAANILCEEHSVNGEQMKASLPSILEMLKHDGYLETRGEGLVFVSNLLRDWWKARFGFGYVRADERKSS
jgi:uncharacterized protein